MSKSLDLQDSLLNLQIFLETFEDRDSISQLDLSILEEAKRTLIEAGGHIRRLQEIADAARILIRAYDRDTNPTALMRARQDYNDATRQGKDL